MPRVVWALLFSGLAVAGSAAQKEAQPKAQTELKKRNGKEAETGARQNQQPEEAPPEEDEAIAKPKEYSFNPLQAAKEIQIGNFYFKKGSYRAAALRFREATRWNSSDAEAWLRLAEAEEKRGDKRAAREAYTKYLEVAPDAKNAAEIRKKVARTR